jgi:hypothetical protein
MTRIESGTLWDGVESARTSFASSARLPVRLLVACAATGVVTFLVTLPTLHSGDYGPRGTEATSLVLGSGALVLSLLLSALALHGARSLAIAMKALSSLKELEDRGEGNALREPYVRATRKLIRESVVPRALLWLMLGLGALAKLVPFALALASE